MARRRPRPACPVRRARLFQGRPRDHTRRIGYAAAEIARHGGVVICSVVAPYAASRREVRRLVEDAGGTFVLVHVSTPIDECERRVEQYALARAGKLRVFTGVSDPYEEPADAELTVDPTAIGDVDAASRLFRSLTAAGLLATAQAETLGRQEAVRRATSTSLPASLET